jgi:hypothetical protein
MLIDPRKPEFSSNKSGLRSITTSELPEYPPVLPSTSMVAFYVLQVILPTWRFASVFWAIATLSNFI